MTDSQNNNYEAQVPVYLFHQGNNARAYEYMGAHRIDDDTVVFRTWAPNAVSVSVCGNFNNWNDDANKAERITAGGIWEAYVKNVKVYDSYKFCIITQDGRKLMKSDPYGYHMETRPDNATKYYELGNYKWTDAKWEKAKREKAQYDKPVNIYEVHFGSWKQYDDGNFYSYRKMAEELIPYVKEMGYTHIEFMPLTEYPFDGSWGYQVANYYAPTSRYGTPKDFMYLVNELHKAGVGVILDWVPAHFTKDAHGLAEFDGTCIYEHADSRLGEHPEWGTKIFNYGKNEVKNFLIANALFWMKEFHIDGIRVDAVASMLYLDYGRKDGQWCPNIYGGNKNLEAVEFFRHLNTVIHGAYPGCITVAEESTSWPGVTGQVEGDRLGGENLGFSFKWNMGWMHDFCEYMKLDPVYRKWNHNSLTFAMSYNSSENYILPLSHDEVVHLKCSMVNKMPGYPWDKYANLKAGYAYMFGHSGKKLLFMGQDFGQEREWSEERELDWYLLSEKNNQGLHEYVKELLKLYRKYPSMYQLDNTWDGFEWMNADDGDHSTYSFVRKSSTGRNSLLFVINMTPMTWENYKVNVPKKKKYKLVLNSDEERFGGRGGQIPAELEAVQDPDNGEKYSVSFDLPPYGAAVFVF